jgi:predicted nucleic acid-binding protein
MGMSRIFWDTNLFIYLLDDYGKLSKAVVDLRRNMLARGDQLLTSAFTLGEILVKPTEAGNDDLCRNYEETIMRTALLLPFDLKAARLYASIRRDRSLRAPDSVQLACAAGGGVDLFITNDRRLAKKQVDGIQFIVSLDEVPV